MIIYLFPMWNYLSPPIKSAILLITTFIFLIIYFPNTRTLTEWNLLSISSINLTLPIIIDQTRVIFRITVLIISTRVIFFRTSYISKEINLEYFITIVMLFVLSINILIFFPNLITLLLGWDGLGLTSYLLVIYYINNKSLSAGIITALTNRIGDALLIIRVGWSLSIGFWTLPLSNYNIFLLISLTIIVAAITKSAQIPFRAWLPAAIAAPTPVSALVHSSTLVTAGVYLIIRFFPTLRIFWITKFLCFYLGALTCMIARTSAIIEYDLKKIIALSTLRQLGIIIISLGLEQPLLTFFHLVTHALFKALLFIVAGTVIHLENNNQDIRLIGYLTNFSNINVVFFNTANLSLIGTPFLAGFYSKDRILETFFLTTRPISTSIILLSRICLTSAYTIRVCILTLWSNSKNVNFNQFCRKITYIAYITLIFGAICGGATINWLTTPLIITPNIPVIMKTLALTLTIVFGTIILITYKIKINSKLRYFINSIWFLTNTSSIKLTQKSLNFRKNVLTLEITFIEKLRGKGRKRILTDLTNKTQKSADIRLTEIISSFSLIISISLIIGFFCYCHYSVPHANFSY